MSDATKSVPGADKVSDATKSLPGAGGDDAEDPDVSVPGVEDVQDKVNGLQDKASSAAQDPTSAAEGAKDTVTDAASNVPGADKAKEAADGATDKAKDLAGGATDKLQGATGGGSGASPTDAASGLTDKVQGATGGDSEGGSASAASGITDKISSAASSIPGASQATSLLSNLKDQAGSLTQLGGKQLGAISKQLQDKLGSLTGIAGQKVNDKGEVTDDSGNVLAKVQGDPSKVAGTTVNKFGQLEDEQGNVVGAIGELHGDAVKKATDAIDVDGAKEKAEDLASKPAEVGQELGKQVNVDAKSGEQGSEYEQNIEDIYLNVNTTKDAINITIRIPTKAFRQG